jgi:6-phosphogluconolactonase
MTIKKRITNIHQSCVLAFIVILSFSLVSCKKEVKEIHFYVGTYTQNLGFVDGNAEGVYEASIDVNNLDMRYETYVTGIKNPSFLLPYKDGLLTVSEVAKDDSTGYLCEVTKGKLVSQMSSGGLAPCHVSSDLFKKWFAVSNYVGGKVQFYKEDNGVLSLHKTFTFSGKGVFSRQDASHTHSTIFSRDGSFALTADLGTDSIYYFDIGDSVTYNAVKSIKVKEGGGPRHMVFNKPGNTVYILNELSNQVGIYAVTKDGLIEVQYMPTIPLKMKGSNTSADIHLSMDDKYLYTSNRGHNSIAVFSIYEGGRLAPKGHTLTQGRTPRNFMMTKDGKHMVVANQDSRDLSLFDIGENGSLIFRKKFDIPTPVCLVEK